MRQFSIKRLSQALLLASLGVSVAQAATGVRSPDYYESPPPTPRVAPAPTRDFDNGATVSVREKGPDGIATTEQLRRADGISAAILEKGRALYKNLLLAYNAAQRHDQLDLRLGLNNANDIVQGLYRPVQMRALMQQSDIIREDLAHGGKTINKALWLPLQAELEGIRVSVPVQRYRSASAALQRGTSAANKDDKAAAGKALDDIEQSLVQQYALMPLATIRADLRSADNSLNPAPPYWRGASEALQSALSSIRWVVTDRAHNWMSAYVASVEAVKAMPYRPRAVHRWLVTTADRLQGLPDVGGLAKRANTLAYSQHVSADALYDLVDAIGAHVSNIGNP